MWNRPTASCIVRATKVEAGSHVQDSLFHFAFAPGTEVSDTVQGRFYRIGKSGEELDMLVGAGQAELAKSRSGTGIWLLVANVVVVAALAAAFVYRRFRRR